jgi:hypothetical protein
MGEFSEKIVLTLIDKLAIGLLIALAIYYFNRLLERYRLEQNKVLESFKAEQNRVLEKLKGEQALRKEYEVLRDQTALKHLQRQIEELYSPLLGLIQYAGSIHKIVQIKCPQGRHSPNTEVWRYFVEKYFLRLNLQMAELIRTKVYLLDSDDLPSSFQQFLAHTSQYDCLYTLWKEKQVPSDDIPITIWPTNFEQDVKQSLDSLRRSYNENLKRLKNAI